jgi:hypothetical protein
VRNSAQAAGRRLKPLQGLPRAHIEPAGNAPSIIEVVRTQGFHPTEIDTALVALGKDDRALRAEPHFTGGRVKIGRYALDKRTNYRAVTEKQLDLASNLV